MQRPLQQLNPLSLPSRTTERQMRFLLTVDGKSK